MENIQVKDSRLYSLIALYDMHTTFFSIALADISDDDAHNRLNTKANHVAWLTGSLVQQRYEIAKELGVEKKQAADELFTDNKGIQEGIRYPSLSTFRKDWQDISPVLRNALVNADTAKLDSNIDMGGQQMPFYGLLSFIIYRKQIASGRLLCGAGCWAMML